MNTVTTKASLTAKVSTIAATLCCLLALAFCLMAPMNALAEETTVENSAAGATSETAAIAESAAGEAEAETGSAALADSSAANAAATATGTDSATALAAAGGLTPVAHSSSGTVLTKNYYSVADAMADAQKGITIVMDSDWNLTSALTVPEGKTVTIDMNCHTISNNGTSEVIRLKKKSHLTLTSNGKKDFTYKGFTSIGTDYSVKWGKVSDRKMQDLTVNSGGLVTGGQCTFFTLKPEGGGVYMEDSSTLDVSNIAIAGNFTAQVWEFTNNAGGICANDDCTINMANEASIEHNLGVCGGVYIGGKNVTISLNNSFIKQNFAHYNGGGIYSGSTKTTIKLENGSAIEENMSGREGGGIYLNNTQFALESSDVTGQIRNNTAGGKDQHCQGGGIFADSDKFHDNESSMTGITVSGNSSGKGLDGIYEGNGGGGIYLGSKNCALNKCTVKDNKTGGIGGGLYIADTNSSLRDCTITGNISGFNREGDEYCGGGVFLNPDSDLMLYGVVIIKDNVQGVNRTRNNLHLAEWNFHITHSTVGGLTKCGVSKGSSIGISLDACESGDTRIGKNIVNETTDAFFMDKDGYYITYGTDSNGGNMWQRRGKPSYTLSVNGEVANTYDFNASVVAKPKASSNQHFWYWDATGTTGLNPVSYYIGDDNKYDSILHFKMPQNNVNLKAVYIDKVGKATLTVAQPEAGKALPATATLSWGDGKSKTVNIAWKDTNGKTVAQADSNGKYSFEVTASSDPQLGLFFSEGMGAFDVTLSVTGGTDASGASGATSPGVSSAIVNDSGQLVVTSNAFQVGKASFDNVEEASVTVAAGTTADDLKKLLPDYAKIKLADGSSVSLAVLKSSYSWPAGMLDGSNTLSTPGTYAMYFSLSSTDKFNTGDAKLKVNITVKADANVTAPVIDPASATYDKYNGSLKLDDNLQLKVTAATSTKGAAIKYQIMGDDGTWGQTQTYDSSKGIVLTGKENDQVFHVVRAWAEVTATNQSTGKAETYESDKTEADFLLDDTLNKSIAVNCSDTALYSEGQTRWSSSFTVTANLHAGVTVTAPAMDGRVFDHWEWEGAPAGTDLSGKTLTIADFSTAYSGKIKAVYKPVITSIDVEMNAPAADSALSTSAKSVKVGVAGGAATIDVTKYFAADAGEGAAAVDAAESFAAADAGTGAATADIAKLLAETGGAALTWSPTADGSGVAEHSTAYTATLKLAGNLPDGVDYDTADNLKLLVNGKEAGDGASASIGEVDGTDAIFVSFPKTAGFTFGSLETIEPIELTFDDAVECQDAQDANGYDDWNLPNEVEITYTCGGTGYADVTWNKVEGFNKNSLTAQTLTATGTVNYPDDVDATDAPKTVTATIKVAAPAKCEAPEASLKSGTYDGAQQVALDCATKDVTIRYTLDGSEPTAESAIYDDEPLTITDTTTLKARAFCDGMFASDVAEFTYSIEHTVTYDSAGGSSVEAQKVVGGQTATQPETPTREGFTFKYWANAEGNEYDFDTPVTGDLTLYAVWSATGEPTPDTEGDDPEAGDGDSSDALNDVVSGSQAGGATGSAGNASTKANSTTSTATGDTVPVFAIVAVAIVALAAAVAASVIARRRGKR